MYFSYSFPLNCPNINILFRITKGFLRFKNVQKKEIEV